MQNAIYCGQGALRGMTAPISPPPQRLDAIADALGVPVDKLFAGTAPNGADETLTLIRMWLGINDAQGRRRVLSLVRMEAERCGYRE